MSLREDFARWREDPITKTVFGALTLAAKAQKAAWDEASWGGAIVRGPELETTLRELRTRADAYQALEEMSFERLCEWLEIDPDAE